MRIVSVCLLGFLAALPLAARGTAARLAPETVTVTLKLNPQGAKDLPYVGQALTLSKQKPTGVKKEPAYKGTPMYGTLAFGSAPENRIVFVLDRPKQGDPVLYVDANGDGNLGAPIAWNRHEQHGKNPAGEEITRFVYLGKAEVTARYAGGAKLPLTLGVYHIVYKPKPPLPNDPLADAVLYYRQYTREGTAALGGKPLKVALSNDAANGRFDQTAHAEHAPPRVSLLIDRDGDGTFDYPYENYDAAKPFNINGTTYEVASISPDGAQLSLRKSATQVAEVPIPPTFKAGTPAPVFTAKDMDGRTVQFPKQYAGKLVMLDFWATWCGPCRAEIPHLVKAYEKYHSQGLEVLGVSLDQENKAEAVRKFLGEQHMTWPQVYDGKFWKAAVAQQYSIESIPHAFLVDGTTGKIVAEGDSIRGDDLDGAIAKTLARRR